MENNLIPVISTNNSSNHYLSSFPDVKDKPSSSPENDVFYDALEEQEPEHELFYDCFRPYDEEGSECAPSYTTVDSAITPLASRCLKLAPFIPQSYNYTDFQINQEKAIKQSSINETIEVCQRVFSEVMSKETKPENHFVTNEKTLIASRFFPKNIQLSSEEEKIAKNTNSLVDGPLANYTIGHILNKMQTTCGKEFLLVRASNPIRDKKLIMGRQQIIKTLIQDTKLKSELSNALKIYGAFEEQFCSRLAPNATKLPGRIESCLKFALFTIPERKGKWLNEKIRENSNLITLNSAGKTLMEGFNVALLPTMTLGLSAYACLQLIPSPFLDETTAMINATASRYIGQAGIAFSAMQSYGNNSLINCMTSGLAAAFTYLKIDDAKGYFEADWNVKIFLQNKMVSVAKCIRSMSSVYQLLKQSPVLCENLEHLDKLEKLMRSKNPKVQKMLQAIHSSTLDENKNFFSLGPVLVAWNLLLDKEVRRLVLEAIIAMGEIEANLTLADAVMNSTDDHPISIPEIVDDEKAVFEAQSAHFLPISTLAQKGQNTTESISLDPFTVVTAKNGAGKTTFGLAWINLILSLQSLGVAACAKGTRLSVFDTIITSKGISDSNGLSTHESHEKLAEDIIKKLRNHPNDKMFFLLDELFQGTHESKGASALIKLARDLEQENPDRFKAVFITHVKEFADDNSYAATKLTTEKTSDQKPSGRLKKGVYQFSS